MKFRKLLTAMACAGLLIPAAPALADPPPWAPAHGRRDHDRDWRDRDWRDRDRGRYEAPRYYDNGRYRERQLGYNDRVWRGRDGRYHCRRSDGTTGLIIGAGVGALLGRALDGGRERTVGTILGAAGGGLLGRSMDRDWKCR